MVNPCRIWNIMEIKKNERELCISIMRAEHQKLSFATSKKLFGCQRMNRSKSRTTLILDVIGHPKTTQRENHECY